jgi:HTH-type transcriptional regulator / antitoxin HigA
MFNKPIISNESDYRLALAALEPLLQKGFSQLTTEEDAALVRVTALIEAYESAHYPLPFKPKNMVEMLELKMFEKKLKQKDLAQVLEVTENRISEVMNGKRKINMDLAKRLHLRLNIDAQFILAHA